MGGGWAVAEEQGSRGRPLVKCLTPSAILHLQARYALLAAELQQRSSKSRGAWLVSLNRPATVAGGSSPEHRRPLTGGSPAAWSGSTGAAAAEQQPGEPATGNATAGCGAGEQCLHTSPLFEPAPVAAVEEEQAAPQFLPAVEGQDCAEAAPAPPAEEQPPSAPSQAYSDDFSICGGGSSHCVAAVTTAPAAQLPAAEPSGAQQEDEEAAEAPAAAPLPPAPSPPPLPAKPTASSPAAAARSSPAVGSTHSLALRARSLQFSLAAGEFATEAERAAWDAADRADIELLRRSAMQLPPRLPDSSDAAAGSSLLVHRLGSRGGSSIGCREEEQRTPDCEGRPPVGIAVPLHMLSALHGGTGGGSADDAQP